MFVILVVVVARRSKILTLEAFDAYVEDRPRRLGCWRDGAKGAYPTLGWLNVHPVVQTRSLTAQVGPHVAAALSTSDNHNRVGIAAGWTIRYMTGTSARILASDEDRQAVWRVAAQYWALRNALVEVRVGVREFVQEQGVVKLPYAGNRTIDALDRILDLVAMLGSLGDHDPPQPDPQLRDWLRTDGLTCPWESAPGWVQGRFRHQADRVLSGMPRYLPDDSTLAGFTMRDLDAYWVELMARGLRMHAAAMFGAIYPPTVVPIIEREQFVSDVAAAANIGGDAADRITTLLTLDTDRCRDPALTPLVPLGAGIIPMSSLIMPTSPQRNALAAAQSDPNLVGQAGQLLGVAGERAVVEVLRRMSEDTITATRVKVMRSNGSQAGDLDVVACSPSQRLVAMFEIKWHIAADGNLEVYKAEQAAIEKRTQVARLRGEIANGTASVSCPPTGLMSAASRGVGSC